MKKRIREGSGIGLLMIGAGLIILLFCMIRPVERPDNSYAILLALGTALFLSGWIWLP